MTLRHFGLVLYPKPGAQNKWLLPVCGSQIKDRLQRLAPCNPGNWEDVDLDGCQTMCYRMRTRQIRDLNRRPFKGAYLEFAGTLGFNVVKEFFPDAWLRFNNSTARARNRWELHHGGIRHERFDRGPSIRAAARLSIA